MTFCSRLYNAEVDEIWQYRMGGNLTIFDKDHGTVLAAKHTASLQLLCIVGGNQARSDARTECKILELSLRGGVEVNLQTGKVTVRRLSGLRPPRPRALRPNLNVATKDKPLSRKS